MLVRQCSGTEGETIPHSTLGALYRFTMSWPTIGYGRRLAMLARKPRREDGRWAAGVFLVYTEMLAQASPKENFFSLGVNAMNGKSIRITRNYNATVHLGTPALPAHSLSLESTAVWSMSIQIPDRISMQRAQPQYSGPSGAFWGLYSTSKASTNSPEQPRRPWRLGR